MAVASARRPPPPQNDAAVTVPGAASAPLSEWSAPPVPLRRTLAGRHMRLEPLTVDHAGRLHAAFAADDPEIWHWLPYGPFASEQAYADWIGANTLGPDPLFFAFCDGEGPAGVGSYLRIAPAAGSIEIGHLCFSARLRGSVAATEALTTLIGWAFEAGYRRMEWKCDALNAPSRRAAVRLGLTYEGVFRQAAVVKGRNRDTAWYAAIDGEWPALRAAYAAWLAPSNFDDDGNQRERLSALTARALACA